MGIVYSKTAHAGGGNGFFLDTDKSAPSDAFPVSSADQTTANNLSAGSAYDFTAPAQGVQYGTLIVTTPTTAQLAAIAAAQQWKLYQAQAQAALATSDTVMHRIGEAVALAKTSWAAADVVAFVQWRQSLRAILSQAQPATIPTALPTRPAYPAGT